MICCKECLDLLYDYIDGNLDQETTKTLEEHFEECPPCLAFLNTYKSTTNVCRENLSEAGIPDVVRDTLLKVINKQKAEQQNKK
ncbi:MAG: zf-HC2 domain-containing protein [Nitrospinota bacterium]